jgi:hypothetical protein
MRHEKRGKDPSNRSGNLSLTQIVACIAAAAIVMTYLVLRQTSPHLLVGVSPVIAGIAAAFAAVAVFTVSYLIGKLRGPGNNRPPSA